MERAKSLPPNETYGLPSELDLKVTARYMMTVNVCTEDGLVNGATGTLKYIQYSTQTHQPIRVWIEFDSPEVGRSVQGDNAHIARRLRLPDTWTPIDLIVRVAIRKQGGGNLQLLRKQFPLVPAMAITIHKSQGDAYNRVAVHMKKGMRRASLYVGCSRSKTAQGLYIVGKFTAPAKPSKTDPVITEMNHLRQQYPVNLSLRFLDVHTGPGLKVGFLNIQSMAKHRSSTSADRSLMAADVLVFVETRVTVKGCMQLPGFTCIFEDSRPPYGPSVYGKNGLVCNLIDSTIKDHTGHIEVTTVSAKKDSKYYIITAVYKSPRAPKQMLMDTLTDSLDKVMPADSLLCIGDFNIDRKKNDANAASLVEFMEHRFSHYFLPVLQQRTKARK
ncbi:hypothetical protein ACOMHN_002650 [Nucella lapillus]